LGGSGLVAIALLVLAYAAVSRRLLGSVITPAMVFVAGGIVASTDVLGWLDPTIRSESVRWVAEATLTVVLFSDASRIDLVALRRQYVVPLRLLAIGLPLTIVAGALAGVAVFGQLAFIEAVLLAIVLAPTDAALGQAVVTDPRIPSRIRHGTSLSTVTGRPGTGSAGIRARFYGDPMGRTIRRCARRCSHCPWRSSSA